MFTMYLLRLPAYFMNKPIVYIDVVSGSQCDRLFMMNVNDPRKAQMF